MAKTSLIAEARLEEMMRTRIAQVKQEYPDWEDPETLCLKLGLTVRYAQVGLGREGAAFAHAIQLDPTVGVPARRQFTFYHEIAHHLLRSHDELLSILHDQYESDERFDAIRERLCNVGAAEFLLARNIVRAAYNEHGFSIALISALSQPGRVSRVAACAQLAFCAPHQCIALVCRAAPLQQPPSGGLLDAEVHVADGSALEITCSFRSPQTKYSCATGTILPTSHLLSTMASVPHGERVSARARIPFRSQKYWEAECECVRLGDQIFAFFHLTAPPVSSQGQLRLW